MRAARSAVVATAFYVAGASAAVVARALVARRVRPRSSTRLDLPGVPNAYEAQPGLWRGAAPDAAGYHSLADAGVDTVVDLRAEAARPVLDGQKLELVRIPVVDAYVPTAPQLATARAAVKASRLTYVHCAAGEGRTGTVVASIRAEDGAGRITELAEAVAIGPLSFAQIVYVASGGSLRSARAVRLLLDRPTNRVFRTFGSFRGRFDRE